MCLIQTDLSLKQRNTCICRGVGQKFVVFLPKIYKQMGEIVSGENLNGKYRAELRYTVFKLEIYKILLY